ncbi:MAG: AAA family ATPase [Polyangiaceae bacterium]|nr:AAA family ATPase [Polyangiaceae bacterium]
MPAVHARRPRFPIGLSDFRQLREGGNRYVDKSLLIEDVLAASGGVLLFPRPRRFGKTVNLSMLRYFLEKSDVDRSPLFAGLAVEASEIARPHRQRYPVIFLTFKDVKADSWDQCFAAMTGVLAGAYREHEYLLTEGALRPYDADAFTAILNRRATEVQCWDALADLSRHLERYHRERVVILIDEYDTPIHAGYSNHYYSQTVTFFRNLLSGGLKDNASLFKGVLTGILRVAKESVFSGLNNLSVYSILRTEFATRFGFTEREVQALAEGVGEPELMSGIRAWYDGYLFGGEVIYNPWSVLSFLDSADKQLRPYWVSTGSADLVRDLLFAGPEGLHEEMEELLRGGDVDKRIEEAIALRDVAQDPDAIWSFLLFSGYLTAAAVRVEEGRTWARLRVPNKEVLGELRGMVEAWLEARVGGSAEVERMLAALLGGDARAVEHYLSRIVKTTLSYHDTGGDHPERVFHAFIVGLLVSLGPRYEVRSNRESGFGRYDVMVLPRAAGQPGVVLELKTIDVEEGETRETALGAALQQIRARDYATELRARGADPIHEMAAVFDGKRAWVKRAEPPPGS